MTKLLVGATDALGDDRVRCDACRFLWQGNRCLRPRAAGLTTRHLAADFMQRKQRCDAFTSPTNPEDEKK